ncbi:MAG: hypothetical protein Tsb002_13260 [Wenzhouxiangellaceae bacterium]
MKCYLATWQCFLQTGGLLILAFIISILTLCNAAVGQSGSGSRVPQINPDHNGWRKPDFKRSKTP